MEIGKRIREKRLAAGLTQQQVADYFGIRAPSVSEWESKNGPSKERLERLARLLKTTVDYLLTGKESNRGVVSDQGVRESSIGVGGDRGGREVSRAPFREGHLSEGEHARSRENEASRRLDFLQSSPQPPRPANARIGVITQALLGSLPEYYSCNFGRLISVNGYQMRFDYVSENLITLIYEPFTFMSSGNSAANTEQIHSTLIPTIFKSLPVRLWNLAIAKKYIESFTLSSMRYAMIIAADMSRASLTSLTRLQSEAKLMGIELIISTDHQKISEYVCSVEEGFSSPFDDSPESDFDTW